MVEVAAIEHPRNQARGHPGSNERVYLPLRWYSPLGQNLPTVVRQSRQLDTQKPPVL